MAPVAPLLRFVAPAIIAGLLAPAVVAAPGVCDGAACAAAQAAAADSSSLGLLQVQAASRSSANREESNEGCYPPDDLVLMHIPFNFGHTIEKVAAFGTGVGAMAAYGAIQALEDSSLMNVRGQWAMLETTKQYGGKVWGHLYPELHQVSDVTGCPMYFTPGKYWPQALADKYFNNKHVFGMLRDPYERLVAFFRGNIKGYGGAYPEFINTCDVNGAVKQMMRKYLAGGMYAENCTFLPQAEYFDSPNGITVAVDNRRFPESANELFAARNSTWRIKTEDLIHVWYCPEVWAGDLDCEAKALVRQVYARDFELLCKHFGYCDTDESCCIKGVPYMCPSDLAAKEKTATRCPA